MAKFTLDRTGLVFFSFCALVCCWAVFDTPRFLRLLSFNRKVTFSHLELLAIRVPGTICLLGTVYMILTTTLRKN
jgi:hypothetical protein